MKRFSLALIAFVAISMTAATAAAQSLADLAKQEEARRKAVKTPSKVITDADVKKYPPPATPAQPAEQAGAPAAAEKDAAKPAADQAAKEKEATGEQEPEKDEAWWRKRIGDARDKLDRTQFSYDAMQTRINSLTNDFSSVDDPAQRAVIANNRVKALGELQRLKDEIDAQKKAIDDIEEEARVAGVPAGWLR